MSRLNHRISSQNVALASNHSFVSTDLDSACGGSSFTTKLCAKCNRVQDICKFSVSNDRKDGHKSWCKNCSKIYGEKYRQTERYKATHRKSQARQTKKYPMKMQARSAVNHVVTLGKLPRAKTSECVYCGKPAFGWHHWAGYEKEHWFDIIPLCQKCDIQAHRGIVPFLAGACARSVGAFL